MFPTFAQTQVQDHPSLEKQFKPFYKVVVLRILPLLYKILAIGNDLTFTLPFCILICVRAFQLS